MNENATQTQIGSNPDLAMPQATIGEMEGEAGASAGADVLAPLDVAATDLASVDGLESAQAGGVGAQALELLTVGGPVVIILLGLSIIALAAALAKSIQFIRAGAWRTAPSVTAAHQFRMGNRAEAITAAEAAPGLPGAVVRAALAATTRSNGVTEREAVERLAADGLEDLASQMRLLEVIASLSPLLGLFGTVLGMIEAFQALQSSGANVDPAILSGGIWVALLTTAVGLAVAMPTAAALAVFERSLDRLRYDLDSMICHVFTASEARADAMETSAHPAIAQAAE